MLPRAALALAPTFTLAGLPHPSLPCSRSQPLVLTCALTRWSRRARRRSLGAVLLLGAVGILVTVEHAPLRSSLSEVTASATAEAAPYLLGGLTLRGIAIAMTVASCYTCCNGRVYERAVGLWRSLGADQWRVLGLLAYLITTAAMVLRILGGPGATPDALVPARAFNAFAVVLVFLRHMRLLYLFGSLGPLVLMIFRVMVDLAKFMTIVAMVLLAFSGGLFTLYRGSNHSTTCTSGHHKLDEFASVLVMLLEFSVNGEADFDCVASSEEAFVGMTLLFCFVVLMSLLLFNMLIAMMAKTFDDVREAQESNFLFLCVTRVLQAEDAEPVPPPLNLLSVPYWACRSARIALFQGCGESPTPRRRLPTMHASVAMMAQLDTKDGRVGSGASQERVPRWLEVYRDENSAEATIQEVLSYTLFHEDEVVEEGRWRTRFAQKLSRTRMDLELQFGSVLELLDTMRSEQQMLGRQLHHLLAATAEREGAARCEPSAASGGSFKRQQHWCSRAPSDSLLTAAGLNSASLRRSRQGTVSGSVRLASGGSHAASRKASVSSCLEAPAPASQPVVDAGKGGTRRSNCEAAQRGRQRCSSAPRFAGMHRSYTLT